MAEAVSIVENFGGGPVIDVPGQGMKCVQGVCSGTRRIRFNGKDACGEQCLERLMRNAMIEEQALATAAVFKASPRVQIGRILLDQGTITQEQLDKALRSQKAAGAGKLGSWLKQQVDFPESEFTAALAIQCHCPVFRLGNFIPEHMTAYLPKLLVEKHDVLPLRLSETPRRLSLCFEDHVNHELVHAVERMHGIGVDAGLLTATEFWQGMRDLMSFSFPQVHVVEAGSHEEMIGSVSRMLWLAEADEVRMVAVQGRYWLRFWANLLGKICVQDVLCTPRSFPGGPQPPEAGTGATQ